MPINTKGLSAEARRIIRELHYSQENVLDATEGSMHALKRRGLTTTCTGIWFLTREARDAIFPEDRTHPIRGKTLPTPFTRFICCHAHPETSWGSGYDGFR